MTRRRQITANNYAFILLKLDVDLTKPKWLIPILTIRSSITECCIQTFVEVIEDDLASRWFIPSPFIIDFTVNGIIIVRLTSRRYFYENSQNRIIISLFSSSRILRWSRIFHFNSRNAWSVFRNRNFHLIVRTTVSFDLFPRCAAGKQDAEIHLEIRDPYLRGYRVGILELCWNIPRAKSFINFPSETLAEKAVAFSPRWRISIYVGPWERCKTGGSLYFKKGASLFFFSSFPFFKRIGSFRFISRRKVSRGAALTGKGRWKLGQNGGQVSVELPTL